MSPTTERPETRSAAAAVAERWADLTRTIAIYPETNSRVLAGVQALLEALHCYLGESGGDRVEILFTQDHLLVGQELFEHATTGNLAWVKRLLDEAGLAGVSFEREIGVEELCALSLRLLGSEEDAFPEDAVPSGTSGSGAGITLIPRQFTGALATGLSGDETGIVRTWGGSEGELDTSDVGALARTLVQDEGISSEMLDIGRLIAAEAEDGDRRRVDVLGRIVKLMPAEVMQDYPSVVAVTKDVLKHLKSRLEGGVREDDFGLVDDEVALGSLMFVMSRRFFARDGRKAASLVEEAEQRPEAVDASQPSPSGHAGDESFSECFDEFEKELAQLPVGEIDAGEASVESRGEQLGACLHYLIHMPSLDEACSLGPLLRRLLVDSDEGLLGLLRLYLEELSQTDTAGDHLSRVLSFLTREHLAPPLRACGFLDCQTVRSSFPTGFGLYLDSLDPESEADAEDLEDLCRSIGQDIGDVERAALVEEEGLLEPGRAARILGRPSTALIPMVRILLEEGGERYEKGVIHFLRDLDLDTREAVVLRIIDEDRYLTREYLLGMVHPEVKRTLRPEIAAILARYVRDTAENVVLFTRRIYAIKHFVDFRFPETEECLEELVGATRYLIFPREPKAVRRAARQVLRSWDRR